MDHTPSMPPSTPQPFAAAGAPDGNAVPPSPPSVGGPAPTGRPTRPGPSRRKAWITHGATALVALAAGAGIGGNGDSGGKDTSAAPAPAVNVTEAAAGGGAKPAATVTEKVMVTPKQAEKPGPATAVDGEGQYLVGEDMRAGTYKTAGPAEDSVIMNCYWARAKDASGEFDAIIANENLAGQGG